ncbi:uncharacterized protein [Henckelia pumila]|uniref:uncharacterized protein n=1 Tax=Henckelia pumila TaxID=405737 RepID=UPI003C6DB80A
MDEEETMEGPKNAEVMEDVRVEKSSKADFVILDMEEDLEVPLILGRPFLAASRALIDVERGELVLRLNDEQVVFTMSKSATESPILKACSAIRFIDMIDVVGDACKQVQLSAEIGQVHKFFNGVA